MACRILVLAEHEGGAVRETTFELLGMAHRLAGEAGWPTAGIKAVLIGLGAGPPAGDLAGRGAAEGICVGGGAVKGYTRDGHTRALEAGIKGEAPGPGLGRGTPER